jgi:nitrogenase iron protein NifH
MMALYAASNIIRAIEGFGDRNYAMFSGLILNSKNIPGEESGVLKFADESGSRVIKKIPRDSSVQSAEAMGMTVIEAFPDSAMAGEYCDLAAKILEAV